MNSDTATTKRAVRRWAQLPEGAMLVLDDQLDGLRPNHREQLRTENNLAFAGANGFPIDAATWNARQPNIKTVRNLRDFNRARIEG